jgi:hypothetical protein
MWSSGKSRHSFIARLESGAAADPRLKTIYRYLQTRGIDFRQFADLLPRPRPPEVNMNPMPTHGFSD